MFAMKDTSFQSPPGRGRGGRPKGDPSDVRNHTIGVRVNNLERNLLQDKARKMGMSPSQWLRHAALARKLPKQPAPELNRQAYSELARVGSNLNQLTKASHGGIILEDIGELLQDLLALLSKVRLQLIGATHDSEAD